MNGTTTHRIPFADIAIPEIKVKRRKGGRGGDEEGNGDGEDVRVSSRQRRKQQKKAKKAAESTSAIDSPMVNEMKEQETDMIVDEVQEADRPEKENVDEQEQTVLAVQKIETVVFDSSELLVFSVVGYV